MTAVKHACDTARLPQVGRTSTWEVLQFVNEAGVGRSPQCYGMEHGYYPIRSDLSIRVAADFYFVEQGRPSIFWLQPRRAYALTDLQLAMFGAVLKGALLRGDFETAGVEILDLSAPNRRDRQPRTLSLADLPHIEEGELTTGLQRVADAYDTIKSMDIDWDSVRGGRKKQDGTTDGPGLFR